MERALRIAVLSLIAGAVGCTEAAPGSRRVLGRVDYQHAFDTSREVMSQFFSVEEADARSGRIRSRPRPVEEGRYRITSPMPARQIATLQLWREGELVLARVAVLVQRQGSDAYRSFASDQENYRRRPGRTPADLDAATTPEQNEIWQTLRYEHRLERTILEQIARSLAPPTVEEEPSEPVR
jgi:hypothetical protein